MEMKTDGPERLAAFETMLAEVEAQYRETEARMADLKARGRERSATYRQLLGNKLTLRQFLSLYEAHGLRNKGP